jgi:hypothetical protein
MTGIYSETEDFFGFNPSAVNKVKHVNHEESAVSRT